MKKHKHKCDAVSPISVAKIKMVDNIQHAPDMKQNAL